MEFSVKYLSLFLFVVKGSLFAEELQPFDHTQYIYQEYYLDMIDESSNSILYILESRKSEFSDDAYSILCNEISTILQSLIAIRRY